MGINSIYSTRTVLRYPRYNVRLNSVRLLAIQISRGILFHTLGLDILMTLNHNSPRLESLVWNQFGNAYYDLYFLNILTIKRVERFFLPCKTLYLTIEFFHGGLLQNYSSDNLQMLIHYRYKPFWELFHASDSFEYLKIFDKTSKLMDNT